MNEIIVKTTPKKQEEYPIYINSGIISEINEYLFKYCPANKYLVVTNTKVQELWGDKLLVGNSNRLILQDGEEFKNFENLNFIIDKALDMRLDRGDAIIAFGGGVIGDMAGFAASIYQRGIKFVQVPTTLLAQVDSSVGGKVAINHLLGKNMIGSFYQPKLVLADMDFLDTLDERQFKTGLAEILKYAFIEKSCNAHKDFNLFDFLVINRDDIMSKNKKVLADLIGICCNLKSAVVFQDEKETGLRAILNFGHTFAHAIEKVSDYKIYTHGEAVAIGIRMAINLAFEINLIDESYRNSSISLLDLYGLNYKLESSMTIDDIYQSMFLDKKNKSGKIRFVLPISFGEVKLFSEINEKFIKKVVGQEL